MGRASRRSDQQSALRRRAESRVRQRRVLGRAPDQVNLQRAVHELEVHQVELEMQNEQMRMTQAELAATRDRYASLFSLAPTAYLVLDPLGNILDATQGASRRLEGVGGGAARILLSLTAAVPARAEPRFPPS